MVPLSRGLPESSTAAWIDRHKYDPDYGFQVQAALDIPIGEQFYVSGSLKYDYSRPFNNSRFAADISDLGGGAAGIEFGIRF